MIDFYGYITTMTWRAGIALEELGLDYRFHSIHLGKGEQRAPEHAARNPMQKVPVIIDHDPADVMVREFHVAGVHLHLPAQHGFQRLRHFVPGRNLLWTRGERDILFRFFFLFRGSFSIVSRLL